MPRIPAIITNSVIYLFRDRHESEAGIDFGGSGFLIGINAASGTGTHCYAVTNAHVIESGYCVVRINLRHESSGMEFTDCFEFSEGNWICSPNHDLAICPFPPDFDPRKFACSFLEPRFLLTREEWKERDIGPGDDVVYVGRFFGHAGKFENMPSVRFGNISMNPNEREPLRATINQRSIEQVAFLVEARSRSGYSGSPVFFLHQHAVNNPRAVVPMFDMKLLGVDFCHIPENVDIETLEGHTLNWKAQVHAGMMGVIPAWYLLDFLTEAPELTEQRKRDEVLYSSWQPNLQLEVDPRIIEPPPIPVESGTNLTVITGEATTSLHFPERKTEAQLDRKQSEAEEKSSNIPSE
jgi:hypothetical protein